MSYKYWETEQPVLADTGRNVLKFYREAGRLQICQPNWTDAAGQEKQGKTVTIDITALRESPAAMNIIKQIVTP